MDIGVIGGADGPTSIFITSSINWYPITAIAIICIAVGIIWTIKKDKRKHS